MCNGAKSASSAILLTTVPSGPSTNVESLKYSPPCTTRWPTPLISSNDEIQFNPRNINTQQQQV